MAILFITLPVCIAAILGVVGLPLFVEMFFGQPKE